MYDILIIGSGGAGLTSAIMMKERGLNVAILSKTSCTSSQTSQAQGGINAVLGNNSDIVQNHIDDTIKSAHKIGNIQTISFMCEEAKDSIEWLDKLGVPFSRDMENNIAQRQLGGASDKRACYSSDYTGLKILHTLYDTALSLGVEFIDEYMLLNLIVEDGTTKGITALNIKNSEVYQFLAKKVVIATGGYGGVYFGYSTNSSATTSDGIVSALNIGCELKNMEFVQFHPTALKDKFILISESARGEGGFLVTKDGKRFVDELLPRDIVAREIYKIIKKGGEVYLDLRHLGVERILHLMPQEYKLCYQFTGLRMDKDLIPITPASHYTMGGIKVNKECKTNIKNLYAVGECSSIGVHGANRLGGNALLEIITFGKYLGENINIQNIEIQDKEYDIFIKDKEFISKQFEKENKVDFYKLRAALGTLMFNNVGLFRDENHLLEAIKQIKVYKDDFCYMGIEDKNKIYNTNLKELIEFKNMLDCSEAIILSALNRVESRGAHFRDDEQEEIEAFARDTIVKKIDLAISVELG